MKLRDEDERVYRDAEAFARLKQLRKNGEALAGLRRALDAPHASLTDAVLFAGSAGCQARFLPRAEQVAVAAPCVHIF